MTAFILCPYADRIEILTDGAVYTADGVMVGHQYKVRMSECVPLAVVGSGVIAETDLIAASILETAEATGSVDGAIDVLRGALAHMAKQADYPAHMRVAIGAISETHGPVCFVFSTFDDPTSPKPAFVLAEKTRCFAQGATPTWEELEAYGDLSIDQGLATDGRFLFECMRRQLLANPAAPDRDPIHSVGGHLDLTILRADGFELERLHEWPDAIGQKIDPNAVASPSAPSIQSARSSVIAGLNLAKGDCSGPATFAAPEPRTDIAAHRRALA
ncbi:hypothetical protein [Hoeflea alexandrii]